MDDHLLIQIVLIICIISVVFMGLVYLLAYDRQIKRHLTFEQAREERKEGNPFLF